MILFLKRFNSFSHPTVTFLSPPIVVKQSFCVPLLLDCVLRLFLCFIRRGAIKFSFSCFYSTIFDQSFEERFVDKYFKSEKKISDIIFSLCFFLTWPFSDFLISLEAIFKKLFFLDHISPEKASTLIQELLGFAVKIIFMKILGFFLSRFWLNNR